MNATDKATILFKQNYYTDAFVTVNQGGTNSGKTYAIMQALFCLACKRANQVITVAGQDIPNLKAGVLRDAINIWSKWPVLQALVKSFNKTDRIFEFHNGSIIEYKSYGDAQDAKSGKRDFLFINEANGLSWHVYNELALRTRSRVYIDYNPNNGFWVHEHLLGQPGVRLIISDHRHNPFLDAAEHEKIERLRTVDQELWRVYARGLTGKITGLVFNNWQVCEAIPQDAKLVAAGLDFGFTNDQTGCLLLYKQNGELWADELFYQTGLTNTDISAKLKQVGISSNTEIIADSAEPKSIEELRRLGWRIIAARKGQDSVSNSIDILKRYRIIITRSSVNLRKEMERYKWLTDKSGRVLNEPADTWNHLIDPLRYIALNKLNIKPLHPVRSRLPYQPAPMISPELRGML